MLGPDDLKIGALVAEEWDGAVYYRIVRVAYLSVPIVKSLHTGCEYLVHDLSRFRLASPMEQVALEAREGSH